MSNKVNESAKPVSESELADFANTSTLGLVETLGTIWGRCWRERLCIRILGRQFCSPYVKACVRLVHVGSNFYVELELLGQRWRYDLASACYQVSKGIGRLRVCITEYESDGISSSFKLAVSLCISWRQQGKCWDVFNQRIRIQRVTAEMNRETGMGVSEDEVHYSANDSGPDEDEKECAPCHQEWT